MEGFVKRMIDEHSALVKRIASLDSFIVAHCDDDDKTITRAEYGLLHTQFTAMCDYLNALEARLENHGVSFEDGVYHQVIGTVNPYSEFGSDYDVDKEKLENQK